MRTFLRLIKAYFYPTPVQPQPEPAPAEMSPMLGLAAQIEKEMFDPEPYYPGKGKTSGSYWYDAQTNEIQWSPLHSVLYAVGDIAADQYVFLGNLYGDFNETI
jgi:hypothetical protein